MSKFFETATLYKAQYQETGISTSDPHRLLSSLKKRTQV